MKHRGRSVAGEGTLCLEVVAGSASGFTSPLEAGAQILGRDKDADVVLTDSGISRHHARVKVADDGMVTIEDLESTNGVFVNARRVDVAVLREGDRIELGPDAILRVGRVRQVDGAEPAARRLSSLSARELEVAQLVARGLTNAEIGKQLFISGSTVARHLANAYEKLDLSSRTALARLILESGRG